MFSPKFHCVHEGLRLRYACDQFGNLQFLLITMLFCPTCANLLIISSETGYNKWACNTCAYEFPISKQVRPILSRLANYCVYNFINEQMTSRTRLKRKEVDDVLGGEEMWKHADSTAGDLPSNCCRCVPWLMVVLPASCDKCNHGRAYFLQLQIRSADEPMTTCKLHRFLLVIVFLTNFFLLFSLPAS